jgi:hypothetical protein
MTSYVQGPSPIYARPIVIAGGPTGYTGSIVIDIWKCTYAARENSFGAHTWRYPMGWESRTQRAGMVSGG